MNQPVRTVLRRLHNSGRRIRMSTVRNIALAATGLMATGIAIGLMGTGGSFALWTSTVTVNAGTITSGRLAAEVSGLSNVTYNSATSSVTQAVTISNTGNVPATYTASFAASPASGTLINYLSAVSVSTWLRAGTSCSPGTPSTAKPWDQVGDLSGNIGAQSSIVYCIRSAMNTEHAAGIASGSSLIATLAVKLTVGGWFATANDSAKQTFTDDSAPSAPAAPTASNVTSKAITLNWSAPSDNVGVTGYRVYRDSDASPYKELGAIKFTDAVAAGSTHTYWLKARDAAGNWSLPSSPLKVTTPAVDASSWYTIKNVGTGQCVEATGSGTTAPTDLRHVTCTTGANQTWQFSPSGRGYFTVAPGYKTQADLIWDVNGAGSADLTQVFLWGRKTSGIENQQWTIVPAGTDQFQIISVKNPTKCLDAGGTATGGNANTMRQLTCTSNNKDQLFTLTAVRGFSIRSLMSLPLAVIPPTAPTGTETSAPATTKTSESPATPTTDASSSTDPAATTPEPDATTPTDPEPATAPQTPADSPASGPAEPATPVATAAATPTPVTPPTPPAPAPAATTAPPAAPSKDAESDGTP